MKKVLSLLMIFVVLQTQSWALSGGPVFGGGQVEVYTGSYAGVLLPEFTGLTAPATDVGSISLDANALGLFALGIPTSGFASGGCAFFNRGEVFTGKIAGVLDPDSGDLRALIETSSLRVVSVVTDDGSGADITGTDVRTVGRLDAQISPNPGGNFGGATISQRIEGTAVMSSFSDENRNPDGSPVLSNTISFTVDGFKQTEEVTTTSSIDFGVEAVR